MIRKSASLLVAFLLLCAFVRGQSVGLVLSGGGAKGLYHIGVIKALEENGIPIDYITGTSIGAIVGGLYAIGYSPQQIEQVFLSDELKYWISGRIADRYRYYFKQMNQVSEAITLRFDFKDKGNVTKIRTSVVPSNQLDMAFAEFFAAANAYTCGDFDKLFVPFRCIATDVTNRQEKVFSSGDIGKAVRSSMAIPFVFSPMVIDSTLMYDGGLFNNFPFDVMLGEFDPDFMIGCSVSSPIRSSVEPVSLVEQAMFITMLHSDYDMPCENSWLINRRFDDVSTMDFGKADYIIEQGYRDALDAMDSIKARVAKRVDSAELAARRESFSKNLAPLVFDNFDITGLTRSQESYVRRILRIGDDKTFTFDQFRTEYFKILSEGDIDGKYPEITFNRNTGKYRLLIEMSAKPSFKVMVGGNISSTALNQAYIGIQYKEIGNSARSYYVHGAISPFYTSFNPGMRIDFFIRSPFYFETGIITNYYNFFRSNYGFLSKDHDLIYLKKEDNYFTLSFGMPIDRQSVLVVRGNAGQADYRYNYTSTLNEADTLDRTRFRYLAAKIEAERKSTNFDSYPTRGIYQSLSAIAVTGREKYFPGSEGRSLGLETIKDSHSWVGARFVREHYFPVRPISWFSWGYLIDMTATSHRSFSNESSSNFTSPGFQPTPHSRIVYLKEFHSDSYFAGGIMPTIEFGQNFFLKNSFYVYVPRDYNKVKENIHQKVRYIFDTALVLRTPAGPISLSLSKYDVSRNNWFIMFNFGTALFNPRGTFY